MLATSGNELRLWEINDTNLNLTNEFNFGRSINSFSIRPDNYHIASIVNNALNVIDPNTQQLSHQLQNLNANCCAYDSSGKYLAIGNQEGTIDIIDYKSSSLRRQTHKVLDSPIKCLSWTKNDRFIASGGQSGAISLFNNLSSSIAQKQLILPNKIASVLSVNSSNLNSNIAAAYDDGQAILWDTNKSIPMCIFKNHNGPCTSVLLSPLNGILMISGGLDGLITLYDISSKTIVRSHSACGPITSLDLSLNGYHLIAGTVNGLLEFIDLRVSNTLMQPLKAHNSNVHCVKFINGTNAPAILRKSASNNENFSTNHSQTPNNAHKSSSVLNLQHQVNNIFSPEVASSSQSQAPSSVSSFILHKNTSQNGESTPILANNKVSSVLPNKIRPGVANFANRVQIFSPSPLVDRVVDTHTLEKLNQINSASPSIHAQISTEPPTQQQQQIRINISSNSSTSNSSVILSNGSSSSISDVDMTTSASNKQQQAKEYQQHQDSMTINSARTDSTVNQAGQLNTLNTLQMDQIKEIVKDSIDDLRDELMNEHFKFKMEIFREFDALRQEIRDSLQNCSVNPALVDEINRLKEENRRLKKNF